MWTNVVNYFVMIDPMALPTYDITARKAHQWAMVALIVGGFVAGGATGVGLVALAGLVMLVGRFWWPADVVRQFVWRVLEPKGLLRRVDQHEDRATRRIARTLGGAIWLVSAVLLATGLSVLGWLAAGAIAVMVVLDATVDFCVLCFVFAQLEPRGLLPVGLRSHDAHRRVDA